MENTKPFLLYKNKTPLVRWSLLVICFLGWNLVGCDSPEQPANDPAKPVATTDPASLFHSAKEKQAFGAYDSAIAELNRAIAADPGYVPAHFLMGEIYKEWDRREEALAAYKKTIELDSNHYEARLALATVYSKSGQNSLALKEFLAAAEVHPEDPEVHFKIALEYWYMQQLEECAAAYRKVIELKQDHLQAHLNIASVYESMKDWDQALREIGLSIQIAQSRGNSQAVAIAKSKLKIFKGSADMTEEDIRRKTSPPFN